MAKVKGKLLYLIIAGILGSLIFSVLLFQRTLRVEKLPVYGKVQDFWLIDSKGREFGLNDLKNKIWVADFIFTTCSGICPIMTKNLAALYRSFTPMNSVAMVSISVNPENDSPEVLDDFAKKYHADTDQWRFLTGSRKDIQDLAVTSFKIGTVEEPIFHSDRFVLIDREGHIRGYYEGTKQESINALYKDIVALIKEKR